MSESVFTYGAPGLKFGEGASDEIGYDLSQYDVRRVLVITDPGVAATGHPQRVADQMGHFGIEASVYDGVRIDSIATAVALEYTDFRYTTEWRQRCPRLSSWLEVFARRPSMVQTRPRNPT